jgi:hypothetical protein
MEEPVTTGAQSGTRTPLCWGQQWSWAEQQRTATLRPSTLLLSHVMDLPDGVSVDTVCRAMRFVIARHASLRSTFEVGGAGQPQQVAWPVDEQRYELARIDRDGSSEWSRREFDLTSEWPLRVALIGAGHGAHRLAMTAHHIATDRYGLDLLCAELSEAVRAFGLGTTPSLPPADWQPADIAAFERSPAGEAINEREMADRYRQKQSQRDYLGRLNTRVGEPGNEMHVARLVSTDAAARLAARASAVDRSAGIVVVAAVACVLARFLEQPVVPLAMVVSNRHLTHFRQTVCSVAGNGLTSIRVRDPDDLLNVIPDAWLGMVSAMRHGYFNPADAREKAPPHGDDGAPTLVRAPSLNVMKVESPAPEYGPSLTDEMDRRPSAEWSGKISRPCRGLNFHVTILDSCLVVELRAGTHLVTADICRHLAARVMETIAERQPTMR